MDFKKIGNNIKFQRELKGITQTELAFKINRTESSIRKYESGLTEIPLSVILSICNVLDISLLDILDITDPELKLLDRLSNLKCYQEMPYEELENIIQKHNLFGNKGNLKLRKDLSKDEYEAMISRLSNLEPYKIKLTEFLDKYSNDNKEFSNDLINLVNEIRDHYFRIIEIFFKLKRIEQQENKPLS